MLSRGLDTGSKGVRHTCVLGRARDCVADDESLHDARIFGREDNAQSGAHANADPGMKSRGEPFVRAVLAGEGGGQVGACEKGVHVLGQGAECGGVQVRGDARVSVARMVVAEHPEAGRVKLIDDVVPEVVLRGQRIGE